MARAASARNSRLKRRIIPTRLSVVRLWLATAGLIAAILVVSGAGAAITPTTSATDLAAAITSDPTFVAGASFVTVPPAGNADGVSTTSLAGFPSDGGSYAILSTGDAAAAASPNANNPDDPGPDDDQSAGDGGGNVRGDSDFDVTILRIDLKVPAGANCLSIDFRFLSEEFPEYVGQKFNDAFIAELDNNSWSTSGSNISAPNNFAFAPGNVPISVNATGSSSVDPANAAGTTYDAATSLLSASTPITAGAHSLYLSIFDQGDDILDSAVFVDNLVLGQVAGGSCKKGAQVSSGGGGEATGTATGTVTVNGRPLKTGPVPYGAKIDVTKGTLTLKTRAGTLTVYGGGVFAQFVVVKSSLKGKPLDILRLVGGDFAICKSGLRTTAGLAAKPPPKKTVRRLFAKGKGSFQTRGQYSSATVRGTFWLTADRCDGTFTQVRQGIVAVLDFKKKKTVLVKAGQSYLALHP
jgi:hypothetical protein